MRVSGNRYYNLYMRCAVSLLVASLICSAQEPRELSIKVDVNLMQVDVTVLDKSGLHVEGLTAADFQVFRDGKLQAIKNVLYVSRPPVAPDLPPPSTLAAPSALLAASLPGRQLQAKDVRRTIAVLIDDLSINAGNMLDVRQALRKFVQEQVQPGDLVAVYLSSGGLGLFERFTTDKRAILASIDRLRYRSINGVDSLAPISSNPQEDDPDTTIARMAVMARLQEEVLMAKRQDYLTAGMLSTAGFIVRGLQELPGRKSLVLFSESIQLADAPKLLTNPLATAMSPGGMGDVREHTVKAIHSLVDLANKSGVVFYTVDPRGLQPLTATAADQMSGNPRNAQGRILQREVDFTASQDGMATLAEETGGLFFHSTNDLGRAMTGAANDQDGYYLIAFNLAEATTAKAPKDAAKIHKLSIKVRKPGLKVRFRKSFMGVPDSQSGFLEKAQKDPMISAMQSPFRALEIPLKLTPLYLDDGNGGSIVRAYLSFDPSHLHFVDDSAAVDDKDQSPWKKAIADQLLILYDQRGVAVDRLSQTQTIRLRRSAMENAMKNGVIQIFNVPVKQPGPYQLRAAMMDTVTKKTGSSSQFIFVPDLKNKQLAMSDVGVLTEAYLDAKSDRGSPGSRVFHGGDKLLYTAYIYNAKASKEGGKSNLETQVILYRDGKVVFTGGRTPFQPSGFGEGKPLTISGSLKLAEKIAPGEYVVQVAIRDLEAPKKHQFAVRTAEFEVRPY